MALSKLTYNSLNVTAAASKGIGFDSDPDALQADYTSGDMVFIKKLTASSSSTLSFVDGTSDVVLDNTYKEYLFTFKNIHPSADNNNFQFNLSVDSGSNYNVTKTTSFFRTEHNESGADSALTYISGSDLAQGTGFQRINLGLGDDAEMNLSCYLHLFNPSSTTFVKNFIGASNQRHKATPYYCQTAYMAGYGNTTSAVDSFQFSMSSGNIDAGDICLYVIN